LIRSTDGRQLEAQRERLKRHLSDLGDLRPGSLVERYRKCGKPNCHCAQPDEPGHGPSWSLTHNVKGKTTTKIIPEAFVPQTREHIAEYQRLRHLTSDLGGVNEKICETRIGSGKTEDDFKKDSLAAELIHDVAVDLDALLACGTSDGLDFEAIETAARRKVLTLAARAIEQRLNADASDHAGPSLDCACGQPARYAGRRINVVQSVMGELKLDRAYYHCPLCSSGFYPRDRQLGIEKTCFSPALVRMMGTVGSMVSFQESGQLLRELAGIGIDAGQVERGAEALGDEIAADERLSRPGPGGNIRCRPPFTPASTVPAFQCGPKSLPGVRANRLTVLRRRGK
jgi:hypothetical protein